MKPKKKDYFEYVVAGIAFVVAMFMAFQAGIALDDMAALETAQGSSFSGSDIFRVFFECFSTRLNDPSFKLVWNENMKKALLWGVVLWFLPVGYYFTGKRNYIAGKEYGTAVWGTVKDISDLFANTLMKKELERARQAANPILRFFLRGKVRKEYKAFVKDAEETRSTELSLLEQRKKESLLDEQLSIEDKRQILMQYQTEKEEIEERTKSFLAEVMWKPDRLEQRYREELKDIAERYEQGLEIDSEEKKQAAEQAALERYQNGLREFYSGKGKKEKIQKKYENADAIYTNTERISIYNYVVNNNVLITGGSGSGKTRGFVIPNLLQAHSSFVITDPKGEILEKAGYFLEKIKGYKIRVLNLDDKSKSGGYNPFVYIHPDRPGHEERVLSLIETLIMSTDGDGNKGNSSDPFWPKAEKLFLQSIFFFVCDGFVEEEQTMNTVLELIKMLEIGEEEDNYDSDLDYFAQIFKERHGEDHIGVVQYEEFRSKASGKTAKSIVIQAVARLAPFRTKEIRRIFSYDSMHLDRLGEEKTAIFVVVPPTDDTFCFASSMLFTQIFQELQYCATQVHKHEGQRLPVPVRFILDEFKNTCRIPHFTKILAYARSFGIGIVPILQSLEQIKEMYEKEWGVVIDNCSIFLYLGSIRNNDTLEYVSKLIGKGTFDKKTTGRTKQGFGGSSSQNFDVIGRELMTPDEIQKMPKSDCLLFVNGRPPFYSEKYDYTSHPNYKYTSDANSAYAYEYIPPKPPVTERQKAAVALKREEERNQRVASRADDILESGYEKLEEIQVDMNPQQLLNRLGQNFNYLAPIRDELLVVDDGEPGLSDEVLLAALNFDDQDKRIDDMLAKVQDKVTQINEEVGRKMEDEEITLETNPLTLAKEVVEIGTNLVPVRDKLLAVDDGEPEADEETLFDDDDFQMDDEEPDISEGEFGDLSSLIAEANSREESENAEEPAQ